MSDMKWTAVEDKQIAEVGFAGTDTLGIRFHGKSGVSEYYYSQVPVRMHRALLAAESKHHYFAENIRAYPEKFPYTRIDPGKTYDTPVVSNGKVESPGTALAKVDDLKPEEVFVPGYMDKLLMEIRTQALEEAKGLDISTEAKRKALKSLAFKVVKSRTYIEGLHKAYTQAEKKRLATVDAEKRRICEILQGIEDEVRAPLTAWEAKEEARVQKHKDAIAKIQEMQPHVYSDIPSLKAALVFLGAVDPETFEEWAIPAEQATEEAIRSLTAELEKREQVEAQRLELEALRAEAVKRKEDARIAEAAEKLAAKKIEEVVEQVRKTTREEVKAELAAKPVDVPTMVALETAVAEVHPLSPVGEDVRQRTYAMLTSQDEADARARDKEHRERVMQEAQAGLFDLGGISLAHTRTIVEAIAAGKIPHVSIKF